MIDERKGQITILDEHDVPVTVQLLFTFSIQKYNKRYIVYTYDLNTDKEDVDVLISEIDYDTYRIKEINKDEIPMIMEVYRQIRMEYEEKE